jgi:hypothetical protein
VLGVLFGSPVPLIDGLGLFGAASPIPFALDPDGTAPFGAFVLPGLAKPIPALGLNVAVQAVFPDPASPIGLRLTWILNPLSL